MGVVVMLADGEMAMVLREGVEVEVFVIWTAIIDRQLLLSTTIVAPR